MTAYDFVLKFAEDHSFITFFAVFCVFQLLLAPFRYGKKLIMQKNIALKGWPPAHVDASGEEVIEFRNRVKRNAMD